MTNKIPTNKKIYVCTRLTPFCDRHLYYHFFNFYIKMGITKFIINFNSKVDNEEEMNKFIQEVLDKFGDFIIYNNGPNGIEYNEGSNIVKLKDLVRENVNDEDYILPTDCDEFHYIPIDFNKLDTYDFDYISGCTLERISYNFKLENIDNNQNLYNNYPFHRNDCIIPKISLCKKYIYLNNIGVGAHYLNKSKDNNFKKYIYNSVVNHFKWSLEGLNCRTEIWIKIWGNPNYKGWRGMGKLEKRRKQYFDLCKFNNFYIEDNTEEKKFNFTKFDNLGFNYEKIIEPIKNNNLDRFLIKIVDLSYIKTLSDNLYGKFKEKKYLTRCIYCYEDNYKLFFINSIDFYFQKFN